MADYAEVNGARTWYDERGEGEPLVLLHGGFTDSRDFAGNLDALAKRFRLFLPERRGHGHTPDVEGPISFGGPAHVVGYSDGASVATLTALRRPDLIDRLVLISGGLHPSGWVIPPDPDAEMPAQIVQSYRRALPRHTGRRASDRSRDVAHASVGEAGAVREVGGRFPDHGSRGHAGAGPPCVLSCAAWRWTDWTDGSRTR
jgi:pimeloyl-ACP methyl ester carboxylesterase